jgi:hypothetical protein
MKIDEVFTGKVYKIVLSGPVKGGEYTRAEIVRNGELFQAALYTEKQVFHHNIKVDAVKEFVDRFFGVVFTQYNAWDDTYQYSARVTKKGKILTSRQANTLPFRGAYFDREKNHILREGMDIPVLVDMGIFTRERKFANPKRDKFIQINRFLELLEDETRQLAPDAEVNIIDFGCGKSYLTFLVYHYFANMRGLRLRICGMDNDAKLVRQCNAAAEKYGYTGLIFQQGEIGRQKMPPLDTWGLAGTFNIVVSLHACDTATDDTLFNAVQWGADLICAVPCCQHELRGQMQPGTLPLFSRYGIVQERVASLATDAIRAALLEWQGYKAQIIELTDRENTAKNLMIRARKKQRITPGKHEKAAMHEAEQMIAAFGFEPTLWRLFRPSP